jgi:hypothetical protein
MYNLFYTSAQKDIRDPWNIHHKNMSLKLNDFREGVTAGEVFPR